MENDKKYIIYSFQAYMGSFFDLLVSLLGKCYSNSAYLEVLFFPFFFPLSFDILFSNSVYFSPCSSCSISIYYSCSLFSYYYSGVFSYSSLFYSGTGEFS